jgi:hypothetical protein
MWTYTAKTIALFSLLCLPSCTAMETLTTGEEGRINITADAEGMKAWSDMLAAQAQIAKDSPDLKGASWQLREQETAVKGLRFTFKKRGAK